MSEHETGQVATSAAEIYEQFFVPALFIDWPEKLLAAAGVKAGDQVLDVACGTGVLAREAKRQAGADGQVTGVDINDGMLAVARSKSPAIHWREGKAENLPFDDNAFDRVLCQFGLMFFRDQKKAISEMLRVLRPGGGLAIAVWASLAETPGYAAVAVMLNDLFGPELAKSIEAPYALGDKEVLKALFADAGAAGVTLDTVAGKARFASVEAWIYTDIKGWTLADVINDEQYELLKQEAADRLSPFVLADGTVEFEAPAHIISLSV